MERTNVTLETERANGPTLDVYDDDDDDDDDDDEIVNALHSDTEKLTPVLHVISKT